MKFALRRHRGFTLVELLVVIGVISLVAAVTLPSVKGLLKDQKITQGVRLVSAYVEGAKTRAVSTGRPVALVIERMKLDDSGSADATANDMSTRLSLGEVFPPYSGDWAGATAVITQHPSLAGILVASIPLAQAASLVDPNSGISTGLVDADDLIQFGDNPFKYRVTGPAARNGQLIQIAFENPRFDPVLSLATGEPTLFPPAQLTATYPSVPLTFRIYRKPSKSMVGFITLPRGICIDLSVSGVGPSGRQFGSQSIANVALPSAGYYGPVYIVFNETGSVQDLYYATEPNNRLRDTVRHPVGGLIHLLVGKTEQVFPNPGTSNLTGYLSSAAIPSPSTAARDEVTYNVLDSSNYWVTINPFTGAIYSSPVAQIGTATSGSLADLRTADARAFAIAGVQSSGP